MKYIFASVGIAAFLFSGCTKEGLDGEATLVVKPAHHGTPIVSSAAYRDSVFIKFDATEVPADPTHDYDALVVGEIGEDHIHVEHPTKGNYSIYCTGWDTTINERVTGGVTIEIKRKERKDEIVVDVPVAE
jgi:hypothetical protein